MPVLIFPEGKRNIYISTPDFISGYPHVSDILVTMKFMTLSKQWQHTSYYSLSIMHQCHKIQEHTRWNSTLQNSVLFCSIVILCSSL